MQDKMEIAPLRRLDDFLLGAARFQLPNFSEPGRWEKRVQKNLIYYQSNYFLSAVLIFLCVGALHPGLMLTGLSSVAAMVLLYKYLVENQNVAKELKQEHPLLCLLAAFSSGFLVIYLFGSFLVLVAGILLPLLITLIHASLRTRNLNNKLENVAANLQDKSTPMTVVLSYLGLGLDRDPKVWKQKLQNSVGFDSSNIKGKNKK